MKRGGLAIVVVGIALLVAAGGVVVWQQRSRVTDLEAQLDLAQGQIEQGQTERDRASRETADLQSRVERQRGRLKKAEERWREQQSCVSQLSDERLVGDQTVSFGVITGVDGRRGLFFDPAEWSVGEDANAAAAEDGEIEPGGSVFLPTGWSNAAEWSSAS
ncbi:MAG: hypothetical protein JJE05_11490 [Actinobacteria bacterium]|nr:hypothetical protein [Actinomycetota bacterium]